MSYLPSILLALLAVVALAGCDSALEAAARADEVEDRISTASVERWCYKVRTNPTEVAEQLGSVDAANGLRDFCAARAARQLAPS